MARYSVATTKDNLSSLIDKALAGEEVIITRHGKPTVEINAVKGAKLTWPDRSAALAKLTAVRESLPVMDLPYLDLKRLDEADGEH
jgi:antitoxin (DNA-binding transcriptional repressor) of toxin-antitoxin stability system